MKEDVDPEPLTPDGRLPHKQADDMSSASYTCPHCRRTSYHPRDVAERYCGACHRFEAYWMQDIRWAAARIQAERERLRASAPDSE